MEQCWKPPSPFSNVHFRNTTKILQHKFFSLTLLFIFTLSLLKVSFPQTMSFSCILFLLFLSFIWMFQSCQLQHPRPSLSFLYSFHPYLYSLHLQKVILHFHLPGVTSDIIMSVIHVSLMFSTSSSFLDVHLTSFHHASLSFLRVPLCSSSGLLLIGPEASHFATIQRWGNTAKSSSLTSSLFLHLECLSFHSSLALYTPILILHTCNVALVDSLS